MTKKENIVILDCYTDEPSGYGVRPYLGTHQINLSQALSSKNINHYYLTIDDLRNNTEDKITYSKLNSTVNKQSAWEILKNAEKIYIIWGCFVQYKYFSCLPPTNKELINILQGINGKKILFYVLGANVTLPNSYKNSELHKVIDVINFGNPYRYILEENQTSDGIDANYKILDSISQNDIPIIQQLVNPIIAEIETASGCNTPSCSFCIEAIRKNKVSFRETMSIINQIKVLYNNGVRHFRLGRQPNFYNFHNHSVYEIEILLSGIREACPDIETLHIDNVNALSVVSKNGRKITEIIAKYCTSGNITPFGVETFDEKVRKHNKIQGSCEQILEAVEIINSYGSKRADDGFPFLLPGINLIHGLPMANNSTHQINLNFLDKILKMDLLVGRLYYRELTLPIGIGFSSFERSPQFQRNLDEIENEFIIPMQKKVYPKGIRLKNFMEAIEIDDGYFLRRLGTSSIKVHVSRERELKPYNKYNIVVTGNHSSKVLTGRIE